MPRGTSGERRHGPPVGGRHGHAGADRREGAAAREVQDAALAAAYAGACRPPRRGVPDRRPGRRPQSSTPAPASCARRPMRRIWAASSRACRWSSRSGDGLTGALATGVRGGAVVVAGDAPGITAEAIAAAAAAPADVALGPTRDGGFGLIRMRPRPARRSSPAFAGRPARCWTRPSPRAGPPGLTVSLLDPVADVDTVDDLAAIDLSRARATRAVLADVGRPTRPAGPRAIGWRR